MKMWITLVVPFALCVAVASAQDAPSGPAMRLREAVSYALEHSPDLKSSQAEVQRREGLAVGARSPLLPQVELSADASRTRFEHGYPFGAPPSLLRFDTAVYTGSADLKFLVWDFGRTGLELAAARERVEAARAGVDRRRQEIVFETARLYLQALAQSDLIASADARIRSLQSLLDRTNELVTAGRAVPVDALKIRTRLAQVESDLATLHSSRRTSLSVLAATMGFEGELPALTYTPVSSPLLPSDRPEGDLLREAVASRAEIAAQDHEVRSGERAEQAARRSGWPRIDFRASVIEYGSSSPVGFPQLIGQLLPAFPATAAPASGAATDWLVGVHVSFPVFDGGRRNGQIQAAAAQAEQARLARQQLALRIGREVRTAVADLEAAQSRAKSLRDSVAESERVLHDERLKYEAGRSLIDFVLDAESALLTSQSLLSQAERSVTTAALALDLGLGRIDLNRLSRSD